MSEKDIQDAILEYLKRKGIFHWRQNSGTFSGRYIKCTSIKGVSDIIAIVDGRFIGIEVKNATRKQTGDQEEFQYDLEQAGGLYILARSLDDVMKHI